MAGVGAHEVFIEGPDHVTSITELPDDDVASLVGLYRARLLDLKRDRRMKYGIIFKNRGASAGASLSHSHSQLIVLPVVPKTVQDEMTGAEAYYGFRDRCPYCDILAQETEDEQRMVMLTGRVAAICPYASRFPFETWILPRAHASHFESCSDEDVEEMAFVLKRVLRKLEVALHDPAYNFVIHTAPFHEPYQEHYHWHLEIIPRVVQIAGFEWGTGFHINPVAPEEAASFLRQV
jgi:UDPglucose--hexose-1-phosphate uridylyltransferase